MFIQNLNEPQKKILMSLAKSLVAANGVIHEKEQVILDFLGQQCAGIDLSERIDVSEEILSKTFMDQRSIVSLILELLGAAYADDSFDDEERVIVEQVASDLSVSEELMEQMEAWVHRQMILTKESELMMES